jgi:hypothetical protein
MTVIEGWGAGVSRPWLDDTSGREWLGAVHRALRAEAPPGRVLGEVREPGPGWNYYSVRIRTGHDLPHLLLLNAAARLVACASEEDSRTFGPLHFREVPGPEVFAAAGFHVASRGDLETQLRPEHIAALGPDEQSDIGYHRPDTVGDVLFNWFD